MSDRRTRGRSVLVALSTLLLMAAGFVPVQAQQTADELRARFEALKPVREDAVEALLARQARDAEARRVAASAAAVLDTLQVGMMRIVTPVDQAETARELFTEVWDTHFADVQDSPTLREATFAFQWSSEVVPIHIEEHPRVIELRREWLPRSRVHDQVRQAIAATVNYDLNAESARLMQWVRGNAFLPPEPGDAFRMVATSSSTVARSCLEGDRASCIDALGLGLRLPPETRGMAPGERLAAWEAWQIDQRDHLKRWFTAVERRDLVARGRTFPDRASQTVWAQCVHENDMDACDQYLVDRVRVGQGPLNPPVRESFMAYALERGGPGAWARLRANPGLEPIPALEAAAGAPIDELVRGWREELLASRPATYEGLASRALLALLWFTLFSGLALRSTRWRLG